MGSEAFNQIARLIGYGRSIAKYKWQILVGSLALMLACTIVIQHLPNAYEATTSILVDPQQVPEIYVRSAVNNSDPGARLNTITQQVLCRSRLQDILSKFNLYAGAEGKGLSDEEQVELMRQHISIQVRQGSGAQLSAFTITFQAEQPQIAAKVADELASSFIEWNLNNRGQHVAGTRDFLSSELEIAKQNLEQQENKLRQFKMSHLGETPDQTATNIQAMSGLSSSLQANAEATNRLEEESLLLTRLPEHHLPGTTTPDPTLTRRGRLEREKRQLDDDLAQLRAKYSDAHPDVVRAARRQKEVNGELKALSGDDSKTGGAEPTEVSATTVRLEVIAKELNRLKSDQLRMRSQIGRYQAKIDAAPLREQELVELNRNYDVSKQHYQNLLDKSFNIQMAVNMEEKQKAERFTVLDPAQVPEKPVRPRRRLLLALALVASTMLPVFLALGKEALSSVVRTESELKSLLPSGVRVVGFIPRIETAADTRREWWVAAGACMASLVLCAAVVRVIWTIRPLL